MFIRENLIQARKQCKLSQRKLGEMAGVSGSLIGYFETGERTPRPEILHRLAEVLGVDANWLATGSDVDLQGEYKVQLDSILELVGFLSNPQKERTALKAYAELNSELVKLKRVMDEQAESNNNVSEEIMLIAKSCCDCFSELQAIRPGTYAQNKERFAIWQWEKRKYDGLLAEYLKLNSKGQKIIFNTATALAATPEYRKIREDDPGEFDWNSMRRYFQRVRDEKGLSLREVAEKCNFGGSSLSEGDIRLIEQGQTPLTAKDLCYISFALGIRPTEFLPCSTEVAATLDKYYEIIDLNMKQKVDDKVKREFLNTFIEEVCTKEVKRAFGAIHVEEAQRAARTTLNKLNKE